MPPKRPIRNVFGEDEDEASPGNGVQNGTPPKKAKIAAAAVGAGPNTQSATQTTKASSLPDSIQAQVAAAKARIQASMNALNNKNLARPPAPIPAPASATLPSRPNPQYSAANASTSSSAAKSATSSSIQAQLEAAKAKVQAKMAALSAVRPPPSSAGPSSASAIASSSSQQESRPPNSSSSEATTTTKSKTPTGIHPLLLNNNLSTRIADAFKKSASASADGRTAVPPEANPYLQASREAAEESASSSDKPKQRSMHKGFQFHKPGRHVREAEEIRREQQMEELKRRIQESARKAGMQDDLTGDERLIQRKPPPDAEWWDLSLLVNKTYDDVPLDQDVETMLEKGKGRMQDENAYPILLYGKDSPIDHYVQHPIPIPAPSDKIAVQPKDVMLTKAEQRKLRRQRRQAELQDKRDRIKMGLLPPDPPKVKLSNLMRVLTSEAVSDPTKVEARVRREIAARKEQHERQNAERKLTEEQKREKKEKKKENDELKGVFCQVYKIKHLISPSHKFKIRKNAQDHNLTGVTIFNPNFALVVVEGPSKALKAYKRLMTVRIDWTDPGRPKGEDEREEEQPNDASTSTNANANGIPQGGFKTLSTSQEGDVDWSSNECELIFEGPLRERNFGTGFRAIACPTDHAAREALGTNMEGYWDVAKRAATSKDDGF